MPNHDTMLSHAAVLTAAREARARAMRRWLMSLGSRLLGTALSDRRAWRRP